MAAETHSIETKPAAPRGWGWRVIAAKEFTDHVVSIRFIILLVLLGLGAIAAVYAAAGGLRDAAEDVSGAPGLFLSLFTVAPENSRIPPFFAIVSWLTPLLGIAFGFDSVNGERAQGTLPRLLSQPIHRDDVINGKFVAGIATIAAMLLALTGLLAGIGMIRLGVVPKLSDVFRLIAYLGVSIIYASFWLALATWSSVLLRRAATSAMLAIASWLVLTLFSGLIIGVIAGALSPTPANATIEEQLKSARVEQNLSRVSPTTLYTEATFALLNPRQRTFDILGSLILQSEPRAVPTLLSLDQSLLLVWPQVTALIALTVVCFAGAYVSFMRQEVRA